MLALLVIYLQICHCLGHIKCNRTELNDIKQHEVQHIIGIKMEATQSEVIFLYRELDDVKVKSIFEFGCGGSTILAMKLGKYVNTINSVESDIKWIQKMNATIYNDISIQKTNKTLNFFYINIGATRAWGHPINDSRAKYYHEYSDAIYEHGRESDLVFVDGRFRVACALKTFLTTKSTTKVLIHDFFNRHQYHRVLKYADIVRCCKTMVLLQRKDNYDHDALLVDIKLFETELLRR